MPDRAHSTRTAVPRPPKPSARVARALESEEWDPVCDGLVAARWYRFEHRPGQGPHRTLNLLAGERQVSISISPTGRSVRVFVDGEEVEW